MQINKIAWWASLCLLLLTVVLIYASLSEWDIQYLIKSDTLYLPSIYEDLFINNNTIKGWNVNPAPNFFPDMPVYFTLHFLFGGDILLTTFAYSLLQVAFTSLLFLLLFKQLKIAYWQFGSLANVLITSILLVHFYDDHFLFSFELLINAFHFSAFTCALACFCLSYWFLNTHKYYVLAFLAACVLLCTISDKLFLVTFTVPAIIISLFSFHKGWKNALLMISIVVASSYLGLKAFDWVAKTGYIYIPQPHKYLDYDNIKASWNTLMDQYHTYLKINNLLAYILILLACSIVLSLFYALKLLRKVFQEKAWIVSNIEGFMILVALYVVGNLLAPILNGNYTGWDTIRYNISAYVFGLVCLPILISKISYIKQFCKENNRLLIIVFISLQGIGILATPLFKEYNSISHYFTYKPTFVSKLDSTKQTLGLQYGIAPYNDAKLTSMFSEKNLRVFAVFDEQTPWFHVTNNNWFYRETGNWTTPLKFDFVVVRNEKARKEVYKLLSPLQDSVVFDGFTLYKTLPFHYPDGQYIPQLLK